MRHKYLWVGSIIGVILVLDQITKHLVVKHIRLYEAIPVIPGFFILTHVRNKGAAFSLFAGMPDAFRRVFFITVALAAVAAIAFLIKKTHERLLVVAFSLVAGGAAGNVIDRIRYGEVVDFISVFIWSRVSFLNPWPSFNVADSAITVGVGLLAIDMLLQKPKDTTKTI